VHKKKLEAAPVISREPEEFKSEVSPKLPK